MGKERFQVRLGDAKGFTEIVTVWAEGDAEAINEAKVWFEVQHDLGQVWIEQKAELIGPDSDPGDLEWPNRTRPLTTNTSLRWERS